MSTRRSSSHGIDWIAWLKSFGVYIIGLIFALITFYFTVMFTLRDHEKRFEVQDKRYEEVGKKFDTFNDTLKSNYENWAKTNKAEVEKADLRAKEEREIRERLRDEFQKTFSSFAASAAGMRVQVETVTKQLDVLTGKIDDISRRGESGRRR